MLELALIGTFLAVLLLILAGMLLRHVLSALQDLPSVPLILRAMLFDSEIEDVHQPKRWKDMLPQKRRKKRSKVRHPNPLRAAMKLGPGRSSAICGFIACDGGTALACRDDK